MHLITKTYGHDLGLSACFRQHRAKSHCRFLHGYPLSFKLTFAADKLDENNWVLDFGGLKAIKQFLVDTFDHKLLVAADDPNIERLLALADNHPNDQHEDSALAQPLVVPFVGCEGFAEYVFAYVNNWLRDAYPDAVYPADASRPQCRALRLVSVEVREHGGNSAIYRRNA